MLHVLKRSPPLDRPPVYSNLGAPGGGNPLSSTHKQQEGVGLCSWRALQPPPCPVVLLRVSTLGTGPLSSSCMVFLCVGARAHTQEVHMQRRASRWHFVFDMTQDLNLPGIRPLVEDHQSHDKKGAKRVHERPDPDTSEPSLTEKRKEIGLSHEL